MENGLTLKVENDDIVELPSELGSGNFSLEEIGTIFTFIAQIKSSDEKSLKYWEENQQFKSILESLINEGIINITSNSSNELELDVNLTIRNNNLNE